METIFRRYAQGSRGHVAAFLWDCCAHLNTVAFPSWRALVFRPQALHYCDEFPTGLIVATFPLITAMFLRSVFRFSILGWGKWPTTIRLRLCFSAWFSSSIRPIVCYCQAVSAFNRKVEAEGIKSLLEGRRVSDPCVLETTSRVRNAV
jgi:hypothetical protein